MSVNECMITISFHVPVHVTNNNLNKINLEIFGTPEHNHRQFIYLNSVM